MTKVVVLEPAQTPDRMDPRNLAAVGSGLLDVELSAEDVPWFARVNPDRIDQLDPTWCVLGQLFGNWVDGLARLFPRLTLQGQYLAAERCGFWVNDGQSDGEPESDQAMARYAELTEQWRAAIVARRETWR